MPQNGDSNPITWVIFVICYRVSRAIFAKDRDAIPYRKRGISEIKSEKTHVLLAPTF